MSVGAYTAALFTKSGVIPGFLGYIVGILLDEMVAGVVGIIIGIPFRSPLPDELREYLSRRFL